MNPRSAPDRDKLAEELWQLRRRRGITLREAKARVLDPIYYGCCSYGPAAPMPRRRRGDRLSRFHPAGARVIGVEPGRKHVSGIYMMISASRRSSSPIPR